MHTRATIRQRRGPIAATTTAFALVALAVAAGGSGVPSAAPAPEVLKHRGLLSVVGSGGSETVERLTIDQQFNAARSAPGGIVSPAAYQSAWSQVTALPATGGSWSEVTTKDYDGDSPDYRDPVWSNSSGGSGFQTGRITGLAADNVFVYAAGGNGGVFRRPVGDSTSWTPIADGLASLSGGDLKLNPADGSLWLATGEGNTGASSVVGSGVYRLENPRTGVFTEALRVGGGALEGAIINKIQFDGVGNVWAATQRGLWRAAATSAGTWSKSFDPPDQAGLAEAYSNIVTDVVFQPGTGGRTVLANAAWRNGASYNGFYLSRDAGATWTKVNPTGAINPKEIGHTEFSYSADGKALYAVVQSTPLMSKPVAGGGTVLAGVFASKSGSVAGPWSLVADSRKLANSGSALKSTTIGKGYQPGVQAWYNNFIAVDPANAQHVYLGLEEVYETWNGGATWLATGRYWNFGLGCWSFFDAKNTCDGNVMHPDQHAIAFSPSGRVFVGNDGGVYSRPVSQKVGWSNYNRNGLRTLQYYGVGAGRVGGAVAVSGGLQDNGGSLLRTDMATMVSNFGGDGGEVLVDPANGCRILGEYVQLTLYKTTNCAKSDGSVETVTTIAPPDPAPRFIAPFGADIKNVNKWVAAGNVIWTSEKGWDTEGSDWVNAASVGASPDGSLRSSTAVARSGSTIYAPWCGGGCNPGAAFERGILKVTGSTSTQLPTTGLPNRYIDAVAIDPADSAHVYVLMSGFSRKFAEGPGVGVGHLFESTNGGLTWASRDGAGARALPDVPGDDIQLLGGGKIAVGTDLGVFYTADNGVTWSKLGGNLPATIVYDLHVGPDTTSSANALYAGTHGRGIWKIALP